MAEQPLETGSEFSDVVANLARLIKLNQNELELYGEVYDYDELLQPSTPSIAVVFQSGRPETRVLGATLGRGCSSIMIVNVNIYIYLEALALSHLNLQHIKRLGLLTKLLYKKNNLFNLVPGERMSVNNASIIGRRMQTNIFLTGLVEVSVPVRFCV